MTTMVQKPGFSRQREAVLGRPGERLPGRFVKRPSMSWGREAYAAQTVGVPPALEAAAGAPTPEQRFLQRATMGWTALDMLRLDEAGYNAWLNQQLSGEGLDDGPLEAILAEALPTLAMSPAEILERYENQPAAPIFQLVIAAIFRAVYSPRQLFERMTVFWSDHFNIDLLSGLQYLLKPTDDREVTRAHALGSFHSLLRASASSPAMLVYLTNTSNVKGHPNENYARELMELHTLGVDGPYTETDVKEVARCFTGWGIQGRFAGAGLGRFRFEPLSHDSGRKQVLGHTIAAGGGVEDGERVLQILADHPATAQFLAGKLVRYFWGEDPSRSLVKKVAAAYSGGSIKKMLKVILKRNRMKKAPPKLKRPFHLMVSTVRALAAEVENPRYLIEELYAAGHLPFAWPAPNGYPDSRGYWGGLLLPRWNFAANLSKPKLAGLDFETPYLDTAMTPRQVADGIDQRLFNGTLTAASRIAIEEFVAAGKLTNKRLQDAVGLALSAPEFQDY